MKKIIIGLIFGAIAGMIDVAPMLIMKLPWDANLSAFSMWVVIGFLIVVTEIRINTILKGILLSFLSLLPCAILIGWKEPASLLPIAVMTTILGGLLGYLIPKLTKKF